MIELKALTKTFNTPSGPVTALDGIDLTVPSGQCHGIVGPSGAGKSTLIRCLTALEEPTSGCVAIDGQVITGLRGAALRHQRRSIGMVFQHVNLFDSRNALGNVAYPLRVVGTSQAAAKARATELLGLVGLAGKAKAYPAQLSGGERQRVGIARALATDASVLLCDEPSSALDWATTRQVLELIKDLNLTLGLTVLIITHEMAVVRQVCDAVTLLSKGKVAQSGLIGEVAKQYGSDLARDLIPLAVSSVGSARASLEVSFSSADFSIRRVLRLLTELGDETAIQSGTLETLAGDRLGRFQLEVEHAVLPQVVTRLETEGLHVARPEGVDQ
ncbi:MAG: ATP-binding cassette domain-containing protein [Micrococcales bacterium]|nr:ATP-binding cassette domain-containing protein [Micrococcales bacterium]